MFSSARFTPRNIILFNCSQRPMRTSKCSANWKILTRESFHVTFELPIHFLCSPIYKMHVAKFCINAITQAVRNACGEWRFKPAKYFYPANSTALSTASTLHFPHPYSYTKSVYLCPHYLLLYICA